MYECCSLREFLRRLPLLKRRLVNSGTLDTNFPIFDLINDDVSRHDNRVKWVIRSYHAVERAIKEKHGGVMLRQWQCRLAQDVADICSEYPETIRTFHCIAEVHARRSTPIDKC